MLNVITILTMMFYRIQISIYNLWVQFTAMERFHNCDNSLCRLLDTKDFASNHVQAGRGFQGIQGSYNEFFYWNYRPICWYHS